MEKEFTFEVKVILEAKDEKEMNDKRAWVFGAIQHVLKPVAEGTMVSELSVLKGE